MSTAKSNDMPVVRNDAHKLIEECMLAANVCAPVFCKDHQHPVLYRVHEGPTPEKLEAVSEFLKEFGLQLGGGEIPSRAITPNYSNRSRDDPMLGYCKP